MSPEAVALMAVSMLIIWGGLVGSIVLLARRPEPTDLPDGGEDTPAQPTEAT
ncbi:methionine/alanine import family NSS transporter small subunit [Demequina sp. NBRC 110053]|uniref:methionine/alanine import family NSS transporter small subunit n=1 Tax=Demequina sp. NBRC 110053 TaxID=1570342 RepID=UPI0011871F13|nr:methionine/alanine import family NSS transporter small subunit [Demequina sp. NBRC 110053]